MATRGPGDPGAGEGGVPPLAAVLLIGNLFLIVGILLVDSRTVQVVLLVAAFAMLGGGVVVLRRHAARIRAAHAAREADGTSPATDRDVGPGPGEPGGSES